MLPNGSHRRVDVDIGRRKVPYTTCVCPTHSLDTYPNPSTKLRRNSVWGADHISRLIERLGDAVAEDVEDVLHVGIKEASFDKIVKAIGVARAIIAVGAGIIPDLSRIAFRGISTALGKVLRRFSDATGSSNSIQPLPTTLLEVTWLAISLNITHRRADVPPRRVSFPNSFNTARSSNSEVHSLRLALPVTFGAS